MTTSILTRVVAPSYFPPKNKEPLAYHRRPLPTSDPRILTILYKERPTTMDNDSLSPHVYHTNPPSGSSPKGVWNPNSKRWEPDYPPMPPQSTWEPHPTLPGVHVRVNEAGEARLRTWDDVKLGEYHPMSTISDKWDTEQARAIQHRADYLEAMVRVMGGQHPVQAALQFPEVHAALTNGELPLQDMTKLVNLTNQIQNREVRQEEGFKQLDAFGKTPPQNTTGPSTVNFAQEESRAARFAALDAAQNTIATFMQQIAEKAGVPLSQVESVLGKVSDQQHRVITSSASSVTANGVPGGGKSTALSGWAVNKVQQGVDITRFPLVAPTHASGAALLHAMQKASPLMPGVNTTAFQVKTPWSLGMKKLNERTLEHHGQLASPLEVMDSGKYAKYRPMGGRSAQTLEDIDHHTLEDGEKLYIQKLLDQYKVKGMNASDLAQSFAETKNNRSLTNDYATRLERGQQRYDEEKKTGITSPDALFYAYVQSANMHGNFKVPGQTTPLYDRADTLHLTRRAANQKLITPLSGFIGDEWQGMPAEAVAMMAAITTPQSHVAIALDNSQKTIYNDTKVDEVIQKAFGRRGRVHEQVNLTGTYRMSPWDAAAANAVSAHPALDNRPKSNFMTSVRDRKEWGQMPSFHYAPTFHELYQGELNRWFEQMQLTMQQVHANMQAGNHPLHGSAIAPEQAPFIFSIGKQRDVFAENLQGYLAQHLGASVGSNAFNQIYTSETPSANSVGKLHALTMDQAKGRGFVSPTIYMNRGGLWQGEHEYQNQLFTMMSRASGSQRFIGAGQNVGTAWDQSPDYSPKGRALPHGAMSFIQRMIDNATHQQGLPPEAIPEEFASLATHPFMTPVQENLPQNNQILQFMAGFVKNALANNFFQPAVGDMPVIASQGSVEGEYEDGEKVNYGKTYNLTAHGVAGDIRHNPDKERIHHARRIMQLIAEGGPQALSFIRTLGGRSTHEMDALPSIEDLLSSKTSPFSRFDRTIDPAMLENAVILPSDMPEKDWGIKNEHDSTYVEHQNVGRAKSLLMSMLTKPAFRAHPQGREMLMAQFGNNAVIDAVHNAFVGGGLPSPFQRIKEEHDRLLRQASRFDNERALAIGGVSTLAPLLFAKHAPSLLRSFLANKDALKDSGDKSILPLFFAYAAQESRKQAQNSGGGDHFTQVVQDLAEGKGASSKVQNMIWQKAASQIVYKGLDADKMNDIADIAHQIGGNDQFHARDRSWFPYAAEQAQMLHDPLNAWEDDRPPVMITDVYQNRLAQDDPMQAHILSTILDQQRGDLEVESKPIQEMVSKRAHLASSLAQRFVGEKGQTLGITPAMSRIAPFVTQLQAYAHNLETTGIVDPMAGITQDGHFQTLGAPVSLGGYQRRLDDLLHKQQGVNTPGSLEHWNSQLAQVKALRSRINDPALQEQMGHFLHLASRVSTGHGAFDPRVTEAQREEARRAGTPLLEPIDLFFGPQKNGFQGGHRSLEGVQSYVFSLMQAMEHTQQTGMIKRGHLNQLLGAMGHDPSSKLFAGLRHFEAQGRFTGPEDTLSLDDLLNESTRDREKRAEEYTRYPIHPGESVVFTGTPQGFQQQGTLPGTRGTLEAAPRMAMSFEQLNALAQQGYDYDDYPRTRFGEPSTFGQIQQPFYGLLTEEQIQHVRKAAKQQGIKKNMFMATEPMYLLNQGNGITQMPVLASQVMPEHIYNRLQGGESFGSLHPSSRVVEAGPGSGVRPDMLPALQQRQAQRRDMLRILSLGKHFRSAPSVPSSSSQQTTLTSAMKARLLASLSTSREKRMPHQSRALQRATSTALSDAGPAPSYARPTSFLNVLAPGLNPLPLFGKRQRLLPQYAASLLGVSPQRDLQHERRHLLSLSRNVTNLPSSADITRFLHAFTPDLQNEFRTASQVTSTYEMNRGYEDLIMNRHFVLRQQEDDLPGIHPGSSVLTIGSHLINHHLLRTLSTALEEQPPAWPVALHPYLSAMQTHLPHLTEDLTSQRSYRTLFPSPLATNQDDHKRTRAYPRMLTWRPAQSARVSPAHPLVDSMRIPEEPDWLREQQDALVPDAFGRTPTPFTMPEGDEWRLLAHQANLHLRSMAEYGPLPQSSFSRAQAAQASPPLASTMHGIPLVAGHIVEDLHTPPPTEDIMASIRLWNREGNKARGIYPPSDEQLGVLDDPAHHKIIEGGPGGGKTATMIRAFIDQIASGAFRPAQLRLFSAMHSGTMALNQGFDPYRALLPKTSHEYRLPEAQTFHALAHDLVMKRDEQGNYPLLQQLGVGHLTGNILAEPTEDELEGLTPDVRAQKMENAPSTHFKKWMQQAGHPLSDEKVFAALKDINSIKNQRGATDSRYDEMLAEGQATLASGGQLTREAQLAIYEGGMAQSGNMDFADLLYHGTQALDKFGTSILTPEMLDSRAIGIDEAQDTPHVAKSLLHGFLTRLNDAGVQPHVYVAMDRMQSLMQGLGGIDKNQVLQAYQSMLGVDHPHQLTRNFRSDENYVALNNALLQHPLLANEAKSPEQVPFKSNPGKDLDIHLAKTHPTLYRDMVQSMLKTSGISLDDVATNIRAGKHALEGMSWPKGGQYAAPGQVPAIFSTRRKQRLFTHEAKQYFRDAGFSPKETEIAYKQMFRRNLPGHLASAKERKQALTQFASMRVGGSRSFEFSDPHADISRVEGWHRNDDDTTRQYLGNLFTQNSRVAQGGQLHVFAASHHMNPWQEQEYMRDPSLLREDYPTIPDQGIVSFGNRPIDVSHLNTFETYKGRLVPAEFEDLLTRRDAQIAQWHQTPSPSAATSTAPSMSTQANPLYAFPPNKVLSRANYLASFIQDLHKGPKPGGPIADWSQMAQQALSSYQQAPDESSVMQAIIAHYGLQGAQLHQKQTPTPWPEDLHGPLRDLRGASAYLANVLPDPSKAPPPRITPSSSTPHTATSPSITIQTPNVQVNLPGGGQVTVRGNTPPPASMSGNTSIGTPSSTPPTTTSGIGFTAPMASRPGNVSRWQGNSGFASQVANAGTGTTGTGGGGHSGGGGGGGNTPFGTFNNRESQIGHSIARIGGELQFLGQLGKGIIDASIRQGSEYRLATGSLNGRVSGTNGTEGFFDFTPGGNNGNNINEYSHKSLPMYSNTRVAQGIQDLTGMTNTTFSQRGTLPALTDIMGLSAMTGMNSQDLMAQMTGISGVVGGNALSSIPTMTGMLSSLYGNNLTQGNVAPTLSALSSALPTVQGLTAGGPSQMAQVMAFMKLGLGAGMTSNNLGGVSDVLGSLSGMGNNPNLQQQYMLGQMFGFGNLTNAPDLAQYQSQQTSESQALAMNRLQQNIGGGLSLPNLQIKISQASIQMGQAQLTMSAGQLQASTVGLQQSQLQQNYNVASFGEQQSIANQTYGKIGQDTSRSAYFSWLRSQQAAQYNGTSPEVATQFKGAPTFGLQNAEFYAGLEHQRQQMVLSRSPLLSDMAFQENNKYINQQEAFYQAQLKLTNQQRQFELDWQPKLLAGNQKVLDVQKSLLGIQAQELGIQQEQFGLQQKQAIYEQKADKITQQYLKQQGDDLANLMKQQQGHLMGLGPVSGHNVQPSQIIQSLANQHFSDPALRQQINAMGLPTDQQQTLFLLVRQLQKSGNIKDIEKQLNGKGDKALQGNLKNLIKSGAFASNQQQAALANAQLDYAGIGLKWDALTKNMNVLNTTMENLANLLSPSATLTLDLSAIANLLGPLAMAMASIANIIGLLKAVGGGGIPGIGGMSVPGIGAGAAGVGLAGSGILATLAGGLWGFNDSSQKNGGIGGILKNLMPGYSWGKGVGNFTHLLQGNDPNTQMQNGWNQFWENFGWGPDAPKGPQVHPHGRATTNPVPNKQQQADWQKWWHDRAGDWNHWWGDRGKDWQKWWNDRAIWWNTTFWPFLQKTVGGVFSALGTFMHDQVPLFFNNVLNWFQNTAGPWWHTHIDGFFNTLANNIVGFFQGLPTFFTKTLPKQLSDVVTAFIKKEFGGGGNGTNGNGTNPLSALLSLLGGNNSGGAKGEAGPARISHGGFITPPVNADFHQKMNYGIHQGVDFAASQGTPLEAFDGGKVTGSGFYPWGGEIDIDIGGGLTERYLHLSQLSAQIGQTVRRGQRLGLTGGGTIASGLGYWSSGAHSHVQIDQGDINAGLNPWPIWALMGDNNISQYYNGSGPITSSLVPHPLRVGGGRLSSAQRMHHLSEGGIAMTRMRTELAEREPEAVLPLSKLASVLNAPSSSSSTATHAPHKSVTITKIAERLELHVHTTAQKLDEQAQDDLMAQLLDIFTKAINDVNGKLV